MPQNCLILPHFAKHQVPIVLVLLTLSLGLNIDIYTPCIPAIQDYFNTCATYVRLTMVMLSLSSVCGIPFWGPLSDAYGRKPILLIGQFIFIIGLLSAIWAPTIEVLILSRFIQGVGSSAVNAVAFAMVGDLFKGNDRIKYFSYLGATITLSLVIGPLIGGVCHPWWQLCFITVLILAIPAFLALFFCKESLEDKTPLSFRKTVRTYFNMAQNLPFIGYSILPPLLIGSLVTFAVNGAFYFIQDVGISPQMFSWQQAIIMTGNTLANVIAGRLIHRFGEKALRRCSQYMLGTATLGLMFVCATEWESIVGITGLMLLIAISLGLSFSIYVSKAINYYPHSIGTASSFSSLIRSLIIGTSISVSGLFYDQTVYSIALMPILINLLVLAVQRGVRAL